MRNPIFTGVMSAFSTPLLEDGSINEEAARKLVGWQLSAGLTGFYVCGATGEGVVMRPDARKRLAEVVVDEVNGRGVVIAHVGAVDLATAVELASHAAACKCSAISSVPPFFYHYGLQEIKAYYRTLAEASGLPTLIYASPLAGTVFTCGMVAELMEIPGVSGLKWTNPDYYSMSRIKLLKGGDINVLNGPDETLICGLIMGADGGIGATYNVMPKVFAGIYDNFISGQYDKARLLQAKANRVIDVLIEYGVLTGIKEILTSLGFEMGYCVQPTRRFDSDESKVFFAKLKAIGYPDEYI